MASVKRHTNWFPIGIIGIVLGVVLFLSGLYAYNYLEWLDTWHPTGWGTAHDWQYPYRGLALPISALGICLGVIGIVGIIYDRMSLQNTKTKSL